MKLKNVIKICAGFLDLGIAESYFEQTQQPKEPRIEALVRCFGMVFDELHRRYGTALRFTAVESSHNRVDLAPFPVARVVSLTDGEGNSVPFRFGDNALYVRREGMYNLCYARKPALPAWDEEVTLPALVEERAVLYGTMREYLCSVGDWSNAKQWEQRFADSLRSAGVRPGQHLPKRRWLQ